MCYIIKILREIIMNIVRNIDVICGFNNPTYLKDERLSLVISRANSIVSGSGINFDSKKSSILASIGEFFEREIFMPNNLNKKIYKDGIIMGYSFIDKKIVELNKNSIIGDVTGNAFVDSCGLASYTNSEDCIFNAIREFIERQSFIFNYLSKGSAKLINLDREKKYKYIFNKYENLKLYNISLIDDYYVILGKAIYNNKFYIGLGASNDIDKAILQCIKEIFQADYCYSNEKANESSCDNKKKNDYIDIFMSLPTSRINEAYRYLDENCTICEYKELAYKKFSIENIFTQLNKQYLMKPIIIFLSPLRQIDTLKFVKVLDLNWFPNLFPKSYEDKVYDFIENATHKKLDRKCNFIPFP